MMDEKTVYRQSFEAAVQNGETDLYHASNEQNRACAEAIDRAIQEHQGDMYHYDTKTAAQDVIAQYGPDRLTWVLSAIFQRGNDARISRENVEWARQAAVPQDISRYLVIQAHPTVLDSFIRNAREIMAELEKVDTPEKLAAALHDFASDFDPYGYRDALDLHDVEQAIEDDARIIASGGDSFEGIKSYLLDTINDLSEDDADATEYIQQAQALYDRLTAYAEQHHTATEKTPIIWDMIAAKLNAELGLSKTVEAPQGVEHLRPYFQVAVSYIHRHLMEQQVPPDLYEAVYNRRNILGEVAHHWMDEAKNRNGDTRDKTDVAAISVAAWQKEVRREHYEAVLKELRLDERSLLFSDVELTNDSNEAITFPAGGVIDTHNLNFLDGYQDFTSELPAGSEITVTVNSWSVGTGESDFATDEEAALIANNREYLDGKYFMDHLQTEHFTERMPEDGLDFDDEEADDELEP